MKQNLKISALLGILVLSLSCSAQTRSASVENLDNCQKMTQSEAEKILGQAARMVESKVETKDGSQILNCKYTALSKDEASGREISLYFRFEESSTSEQAKQIYQKIWQSNKNHQGIEVLNGLGDEAYFHSDSPNFHFILIRKGKFTVRLKVNKAVKTTSPDEVKAFAKKVAGEI
jgi:hypothetical protein